MNAIEKLRFFEEYTIKPWKKFIEKELTKIVKVKVKLINPKFKIQLKSESGRKNKNGK